jgi:hypothetical protein
MYAGGFRHSIGVCVTLHLNTLQAHAFYVHVSETMKYRPVQYTPRLSLPFLLLFYPNRSRAPDSSHLLEGLSLDLDHDSELATLQLDNFGVLSHLPFSSKPWFNLLDTRLLEACITCSVHHCHPLPRPSVPSNTTPESSNLPTHHATHHTDATSKQHLVRGCAASASASEDSSHVWSLRRDIPTAEHCNSKGLSMVKIFCSLRDGSAW